MGWYKDWEKDYWETDERFVFVTSLMGNYDFTGKTVLDLGALRGSLSYAALLRGAKHVTLIEKKPEPLQYAENKLKELDPSGEKFRCIVGDFFEEEFPNKVDVVLACGILYHTSRQHELMAKIHRSLPEWVLLETLRNPPSDFVEVHFWPNQNLYVPNAKLCEMIFRECGYRKWEWNSYVPGRGAYVIT